MRRMIEYKYVGHFYHGRIVHEGRLYAEDYFLVIDEFERPGEFGYAPSMYCVLLNIRTDAQHEVHSGRLRRSSHYKRVA